MAQGIAIISPKAVLIKAAVIPPSPQKDLLKRLKHPVYKTSYNLRTVINPEEEKSHIQYPESEDVFPFLISSSPTCKPPYSSGLHCDVQCSC